MLNIDEHDECSLLKSFGSLRRLVVDINDTWRLVPFRYFSDKDAKTVKLGVISLTSAVAAMLGRLLPELIVVPTRTPLHWSEDGRNILQAEEMKALLGGFNKTVPLSRLTFRGFSVRGCLFPLFRSFRFFPNLVQLKLTWLDLDEHDLRDLLESFQFITNLELLDLSHNPLGHTVISLVPPVINLKRLVRLCNTVRLCVFVTLILLRKI